MRFQPQLLDEIRARLSVSQVVSRRVKLRRQGREFVGLSPFKAEKTPSFTVNDQKGFYHCFATGEHGDIFTFLMKTEGLAFPEAVEKLAGEAGVPMPVATEADLARVETNDRLRQITEQAANFYSHCLTQPAAAHARDYLRGRGLSEAIIARFRIGYAPGSRSALRQFLEGKGFTIEEIILSGMAIGGEDIPVPYDRFRDRIMFPITDLKERTIAFGGRALSPDAPAKYLNSPETPLFHKGHQLYNGASARKAAYDEKSIIVAEGYMDVIAMAAAGFNNSVAPLGTALTAEQIQLLWRMAEEPVLCFDGDSAGRKAAFRAVETALALLRPGYSLKFAFLPDGQDPDDLLKNDGPEALRAVLNAARPLSDVLWQKEFEAGDWTTPERRAALEQNLMTLINTVENQTVRGHYMREIKSRLWRAFQSSGRSGSDNSGAGQTLRAGGKAPGKGTGGQNWGKNNNSKNFPQPKAPASHYLTDSPLTKGRETHNPVREASFITMVMDHPWLLETADEEFASLKFTTADAETLRNALLDAHFTHNSLDRGSVQSHLEKSGLSSLAAQMHSIIARHGSRSADQDADPQTVRDKWHELMMLHHKAEELKRELDAAERALLEDNSQQNFDRLKLLKEALEQSLNRDL